MTTTRTRFPVSAAVVVYVRPVAPAMSAQAPPFASQRCQRYAKARRGVPVHVPRCAVSVRPSSATPSTVGGSMLDGATGATASVPAESRVALPTSFVAVTRTRTTWPTSSGSSV